MRMSLPASLTLPALLFGGIVVGAACTNDFGQYDFDGDGGSGLVFPTTSVGGSGATGPGGMGGSTGGSGGSTGQCETNEDCGTDSTCRQTVCSSENQCLEFNGSLGTDCTQQVGGAGYCDGVGNCVECIDGTQCMSGVCDTFFNTCIAPDCMDTVLNGAETDVDCGGGMCTGCADGQMCNGPTDCVNGNCNAGTCAPCIIDTDCAAANTWCDAGVCLPQKMDGDACGGANECLNGFCPADDGVCCDVACEGLCESCVAADTGQAADGTCDAVIAATDPKGECTLDPLTCQGDFCGGVGGQCEPAAATEICRTPMGLCDAQEMCDGVSVGCPADLKEPNTTVCAPVTGLCDVAESCDGMNDACPTDMVAPLNTTCRPAADLCDAIELCDGVNPACPTDLPLPMNIICRPALGSCDLSEVCDGAGFACPMDGFIADNQSSTMDMCNPYLCDGMMAGCPGSCVGTEDCVSGLSCVGTMCQ
jgi:hypothetical protein